MAKVYEFPTKKVLPAFVENGLDKIAKEYVELIYATYMLLGDGEEDLSIEKSEEINLLLGEAFAKGIAKAIDEVEES